ncbi:MAG TPA: sigma factor [Terriglobales bacterium]|nr:sigma factor [Terriglobales bacterium]
MTEPKRSPADECKVMSEQEWLADKFEENRGRLRAVAYRMLGSFNEADDAVQEPWLRLSRSDAATIENLGGWLTTVVSRVCLDILRSRRSRKEEAPEAKPAQGTESARGAGDKPWRGRRDSNPRPLP